VRDELFELTTTSVIMKSVHPIYSLQSVPVLPVLPSKREVREGRDLPIPLASRRPGLGGMPFLSRDPDPALDPHPSFVSARWSLLMRPAEEETTPCYLVTKGNRNIKYILPRNVVRCRETGAWPCWTLSETRVRMKASAVFSITVRAASVLRLSYTFGTLVTCLLRIR